MRGGDVRDIRRERILQPRVGYVTLLLQQKMILDSNLHEDPEAGARVRSFLTVQVCGPKYGNKNYEIQKT